MVQGILVDTDAYLAAVCRYVELNPVRGGMVAAAAAPLLGSPQIPLPQRSMPLTLAEWLERCETREEALIDDGPPKVRPEHGGDGG